MKNYVTRMGTFLGPIFRFMCIRDTFEIGVLLRMHFPKEDFEDVMGYLICNMGNIDGFSHLTLFSSLYSLEFQLLTLAKILFILIIRD